MECPICLETYDDAEEYVCEVCKAGLCIQCLQNLKKEECPFCRLNFSKSMPSASTEGGSFLQQTTPPPSLPVFSQYSQSLPAYFHPSTIVPEWERSRILTRQLRRERKRQEREHQQLRNAELSRIHNMERRHANQPPSRQERRNDLLFDMEIDR